MTKIKRQRRTVSALRQELREIATELHKSSSCGDLFREFLRLQNNVRAYEEGGEDGPYAHLKSTQEAIHLAFELLGVNGRYSKDDIFEELYEGGLPRAKAEGGKNSIMTTINRLRDEGELQDDGERGGSSLVWKRNIG